MKYGWMGWLAGWMDDKILGCNLETSGVVGDLALRMCCKDCAVVQKCYKHTPGFRQELDLQLLGQVLLTGLHCHWSFVLQRPFEYFPKVPLITPP